MKSDNPSLVPVGVLDGIDDIADGKTAGKEELDAVLKY